MISFRCKKCRHNVIDNSNGIIDSHSNPINLEFLNLNCKSENEETLWYLNHEEIPWINSLLNKNGWTKGKVNCPNCNIRLGSYDFISGHQCSCGCHTTPSVHFVKCKIDLIKTKTN